MKWIFQLLVKLSTDLHVRNKITLGKPLYSVMPAAE